MNRSITALILAATALGVARYSSAARPVQAQAQTPLIHRESSFDLVVHKPYALVAPLFGAEGERVWAGSDWDPHFVFPMPAQDVPGAIFTVDHGGHHALWVTPIFDLNGRHIQHVNFIPDAMVTRIDITFPATRGSSTTVHVVYERTALAPQFNANVERQSSHAADTARDWQTAIDAYFQTAHPQ